MKTFRSQYRLLRSDGHRGVRTTAMGFCWHATVEQYRYDPNQLRKLIEDQTPENEALRENAKRNKPPQVWFESTDDPTQPED